MIGNDSTSGVVHYPCMPVRRTDSHLRVARSQGMKVQVIPGNIMTCLWTATSDI